jgi:uncharacterized integral membrane protein
MSIGTRLRKRWYLVILSVIIALGAAATTQVKIGHGGLKRKRTVYRVASGQILLDTNPSTLTNLRASAGGLNGRTQLIAQYATGPSVVREIASLAKVSPHQLTVQAQSTQATKVGGSSSKNVLVKGGPDSVLLRAGHDQTITVSTQAKTRKLAKQLAEATITGLIRSLRHLQNSQAFNRAPKVPSATVTTSSSTTTSPSTSTTGKKSGSTSSSADRAKALAAKKAEEARKAAIQKANQISQSKIILRRFGSVTSTKVVITPKKSTTIAIFVGVLIGLLLVVLVLDNMVTSTRRKPVPAGAAAGAPPPSSDN